MGRKQIFAGLLAVCMTLTLFPTQMAHAIGVPHIFKFENYEAKVTVSVSNETGTASAETTGYGFVVGKNNYNLYVGYNGWYGDVADEFSADIEEGAIYTLIDDISKCHIALDTAGSSGKTTDSVYVVINDVNYSFDANGRIDLSDVPETGTYVIGMTAAQAT